MGKDKLRRWAEMEKFPNVIQCSGAELLTQDHSSKGNWHAAFFKNQNPIILELGCGKGEYTVGLATRYPDKNFIGVDIKGARIWRGAKTSVEEKMNNVGFIRTRIDFLPAFFAPNEVDEIWLTFSDPQPRAKRDNRRLSSAWFLERYSKFLKPDGIIHVKTDSDLLYEYTLEVCRLYNLQLIENSSDLYGTDFLNFDEATRDILDIRTYYEQRWLSKGKKIKYVKFHLPENFKWNPEIIIEMDPALSELEEYYKTIDGVND